MLLAIGAAVVRGVIDNGIVFTRFAVLLLSSFEDFVMLAVVVELLLVNDGTRCRDNAIDGDNETVVSSL